MRSSPVERFSDKEEVEGSIPSAPTRSIRDKLSLLRGEWACLVPSRKGNFSVGIEIDHSQIRKKPIEKLNALKPDLEI